MYSIHIYIHTCIYTYIYIYIYIYACNNMCMCVSFDASVYRIQDWCERDVRLFVGSGGFVKPKRKKANFSSSNLI